MKRSLLLAALFAGSRAGVPANERGAWLALTRCRFAFLLFRKVAVTPQAHAVGAPQPRAASSA